MTATPADGDGPDKLVSEVTGSRRAGPAGHARIF